MFQLGGIGVVLMLIFGFWVFIGDPGHGRIDRACKPVEKFGNITTSLAAVTWSDSATSMREFWEGVDYSCEYMLWRLFHEEAYLEAQRQAAAMGEVDEGGDQNDDLVMDEPLLIE